MLARAIEPLVLKAKLEATRLLSRFLAALQSMQTSPSKSDTHPNDLVHIALWGRVTLQ
jgi:hypothetical protein